MSSRLLFPPPIRVLEEEGQCARCEEIFPFVNIIKCREMPRKEREEYSLCLTCHQRLHPGCLEAQSVLTARHYDCSLCAGRQGELVCALCTLDDVLSDEILDGVLMCGPCSERVHCLHKAGHKDHFYPVATRCSVAVMGRVGWHNVPDPRFLPQQPPSAYPPPPAVSIPLLSNPTPTSTPTPAPNVGSQASGGLGASRLERTLQPRNMNATVTSSLPTRGVASGVRHIVIGGNRSGRINNVAAQVPRRQALAGVNSHHQGSGATTKVGGRFYRLE